MEDMPLRLLIVAVVLSSTLPYIADALRGYSEESTLSYLEGELERFLTAAQTVYRLGVGSVRVVTLSIRSPGVVSVERVTIGGDFGEGKRYLPVIRVKLSGGEERFLVTEPNVPMTSSELGGVPLVLEEGEWKIKLEHREAELEGASIHYVDLSLISHPGSL